MRKLSYLILLVPLIALSAPTKKDKAEISEIVERSGQILGGLIECDRQDLRDEYMTVLRDALKVYPGTDPTKVRSLIRQIERQGEVYGKMGIKGIPSPTSEELESQKKMCVWHVSRAKRDMQTMDGFILK